MMKKLLYGALAFSPAFAFAQGTGLTTINTNIITPISHAVNLLIPVAFGLAVLFFFYGVALYILSAGDPAAASKGKSIMIYGVIALAVMASVWGLVIYLQNTLGVNNNPTSIPTPTVNGLQ
jgi:hypothetical protein